MANSLCTYCLCGEVETRWTDGSSEATALLKFHFTDAQGNTHILERQDRPGMHKNGETVPVFYNPRDSKKAMLGTSRNMYGWPCGISLIGVCMCIIAFLMTLRPAGV